MPIPLNTITTLSIASFLILFLATFLTATLLRRSSAAARHLTWTAAIFCTLCLPIFSLLPAPQALPTPLATFPRLTNLPSFQITPLPSLSQPDLTSPTPHLTFHIFSPSTLIPLYVLGLLTFLAPLLLTPLLLSRLRRHSTPATDPLLLTTFEHCRQSLHITRPTPLLLSTSPTTMPQTFGLFLPHILLPSTSPTWPISKLQLVLSHELAHIHRRDCLTDTLAQLARALHWFNPLSHYALSRMRLERERACDDLVLHLHSTKPSDYADTLLNLTATLRPSSRLLPIMPMARPSHLHTRLLAILDPKRNRSPLTRRLTIAILLISPLFALPLSCTHSSTQPASIAATPQVAGPSEVDQYGWTPETRQAAMHLKTIGQAILLYANDNQFHLPPDLGATLHELDGIPSNGALYYLDPRDHNIIPPAPTPDWINKHTPYIYLGFPTLRLRDIPFSDNGSTTILVHEDLSHPHPHAKDGPVIVALYADGHAELLPLPTARQQIESSKQIIAKAPRTSTSAAFQADTLTLNPSHKSKFAPNGATTWIGTTDITPSPHPTPLHFDLGDSSFLPGDSITISHVFELSPPISDLSLTRTLQVTGTYTLASHDSALLGAEITSNDPLSGKGGYAKIDKGAAQPFSLTFTLAGNGNPHVSFYPANGGESFGGIYYGSGATLLNHNKGFSQNDPAPAGKEHLTLRTTGPAGQHFAATLYVDGKPQDFTGISPAELPLDCHTLSGSIRLTSPITPLSFEIIGHNRQCSFGATTPLTRFHYEGGALVAQTLP